MRRAAVPRVPGEQDLAQLVAVAVPRHRRVPVLRPARAGEPGRAGSEAGHIEWGGAGPHDAGGYNNLPHETGFFRAHTKGAGTASTGSFSCRGTRASSWSTATACYSVRDRCSSERTWQSRLTRLLWTEREKTTFTKKEKKGRERRRRNARRATRRPIDLPPGRRWRSSVRACTGGTTAGATPRSSPRGTSTRARATTCPERDGYEPIVMICGKHGARLNFTCAEMRDVEHPFFSRCGPEGLLRQIRAAAARYGVKVAGENALCRFDQDAYDKIITNCRGEGDDAELWRAGTLLPADGVLHLPAAQQGALRGRQLPLVRALRARAWRTKPARRWSRWETSCRRRRFSRRSSPRRRICFRAAFATFATKPRRVRRRAVFGSVIGG